MKHHGLEFAQHVLLDLRALQEDKFIGKSIFKIQVQNMI